MSVIREKRDVTPITKEEDRKVYFAVRKIFSGEDVDEKTYDTTSYTCHDIWAYLLTYGYQKEDDRLNYTIKKAENLIQLRKKYGLSPSYEPEYWQPKWTFSIPLSDFQKWWPSCMYGRDSSGTLCGFDTIGNVKYEFLKRLQTTPDGWEAASHYIVRNMENTMRVKLMMSNEKGYRITSQCCIVDASSLGLTTLNIMREFLKKVTGDIQQMYPEVVKRSYLVNCGWLFNAAWKIVKNFLHPETVTKIVVYGSDYKNKLKNAGITKIPTFLGGTYSDYIPGLDKLYPVGSRILADKGSQEESKSSPPIELEVTLDESKTKPDEVTLDESKTKPDANLVSDTKNENPYGKELGLKAQIEIDPSNLY
jgi:hypothetical protein